jgi:membrane-bound serine protease (ClpP class)
MDFAQAIFDFIANPNVAYVLLILGLVSLVVAFTAPGTGFAEAAAALCIILALVGLSQLPVNIAGVLLILLGIGLFLADVKLQSGFVAVGGALTLGLGSLFLFRPDHGRLLRFWPEPCIEGASSACAGGRRSVGWRARCGQNSGA